MKNDKKLIIRLPEALLDNAKKASDNEDISLSKLVRNLLNKHIKNIK